MNTLLEALRELKEEEISETAELEEAMTSEQKDAISKAKKLLKPKGVFFTNSTAYYKAEADIDDTTKAYDVVAKDGDKYWGLVLLVEENGILDDLYSDIGDYWDTPEEFAETFENAWKQYQESKNK